jgi:hypothetical protein
MISLDDIAAVQEATVQSYTTNLDPQAGLRAQKAQVIFQMLANSPFLQGNYLRQWRLLVWFARVLDNEDDMTQFIGSEDEAKQMNDAYQQQMAESTTMMMQGAGGQQVGQSPMPATGMGMAPGS